MDKCYICNEPAKYKCEWYTDTGEGGTELMQKPVCQKHYDDLLRTVIDVTIIEEIAPK